MSEDEARDTLYRLIASIDQYEQQASHYARAMMADYNAALEAGFDPEQSLRIAIDRWRMNW